MRPTGRVLERSQVQGGRIHCAGGLFTTKDVGVTKFVLKFLLVWILAVVWPLALLESNNAVRKLLLSPTGILGVGFVILIVLPIEEWYRWRKREKEANLPRAKGGEVEIQNQQPSSNAHGAKKV
jgi:hypothetical protein